MIDEHDDSTDSLPLDDVAECNEIDAECPEEMDHNKLVATNQQVSGRDEKTGRFVKGWKGGGRPVGSKDKVSTRLVNLMTEMMEKRGEELIERIADDDPAAALAILTRIVPQAELQRIFLDGDEDKQERDTNITIRLVNQQENQALTHDTPRLVEGELVTKDTTH